MHQLMLWDEASTQETPAPTQAGTAIVDLLQQHKVQCAGIFEMMEIAEHEIEQAMQRHTHVRHLIYGAFLTLRPAFEMAPKAYAAHCRELLNRVAHDEPLNVPTSAELIAALQKVAWIIPMHNEPSALFAKLFQELFPDMVFDGLEMLSERYPGETDPLREDLRRMLAKGIKRIPPVERIPFKELLQREKAEGHPDGWADEQNMLQIRRARSLQQGNV